MRTTERTTPQQETGDVQNSEKRRRRPARSTERNVDEPSLDNRGDTSDPVTVVQRPRRIDRRPPIPTSEIIVRKKKSMLKYEWRDSVAGESQNANEIPTKSRRVARFRSGRISKCP